MFNGFELSEITKYLCYQDFINFRKVSKSIYKRTKNEYILRKCIATLSLNKIKKCWCIYKIKNDKKNEKKIFGKRGGGLMSLIEFGSQDRFLTSSYYK